MLLKLKKKKGNKKLKTEFLVFQRTFHYDSHFWSNKNVYHLTGGKTGFDSQETKLPTYWNTPFNKICLGMKIGHQLRFILINRRANSLFSLMGNTAPPHWVVTRGSGWLVHRPPCSPTAIRKDSMRWETTLVIPKQESASPLTRRMTVVPVTPASVLAQEVYMMIPTRAGMRQRTRQIMETSTSKPWGTSWYSDRGHS